MSEQIVKQIPLDKIICPKQVREHFDEKSLAELCQSMKENGLIEPIHVAQTGEQFTLLIGGRRVAAARKLGWTVIHAIIEPQAWSKSETRVRQIVENFQRQDLNPVEKAKGISAAMEENGWSAAQMAEKLGTSGATITRLTAVLSHSPEIQQRIASGQLSLSAAYELTKVKDPQQREQFANDVADGLSRDALSGKVKRQRRPGGDKSGAGPTRVTAALPKGVTVTVSSSALNMDTFITILDDLRSRAAQAQRKGISLWTFADMLRDQSKSAQ